MINAYEVAIKLKAEDQFSDAMKKLIKYIGDATETTAKLEHNLKRTIRLVRILQGMDGKGSGLTKWLDDTSSKISRLDRQMQHLHSLREESQCGNEAKHGGAAKHGKGGKSPGGLFHIARMGDAATSLEKLSKTLESFSQKAEQASRIATKVGDFSKKMEKLAKNAGFERVSKAMGKVGKLMDNLAGKAHKVSSVSNTLSKVTGSLANFAKHISDGHLGGLLTGGAAKPGKGSKSPGGIFHIARMGDAASSLEKLSKSLGSFSQKAAQASKIATKVGAFSKKMEKLAKNAGFERVSKTMGKVGELMDGLAGKASKVSSVTKTLSNVTGSLANFAKDVSSGQFGKISSGLGKLKSAFSKASPLFKSIGNSAGKFFEGFSKKASSVASSVLDKAGSLKNMAAGVNKGQLLKGAKLLGTRALTALGPIGDAAFGVMDAYKAVTTGKSDSYDFVNSIGSTITGNKDWTLGGMFGQDAAEHDKELMARFYKEHPGHPTVRPGAGQAVHVKAELHVDGRKMAENVTHHQTRAANRPHSGTTRFDGSRGQRPVNAAGGVCV